jgi:hypothetical protein
MPARDAIRHSLLLTFLIVASVAATALPAQAHSGSTRWDCLAHYESSHRWHINSGNGHYGGLQFSLSTWRYYGGPRYSGNAYPHRATRAEQIVVAKRVAWKGWAGRAAQGGANAWPNTWPRCN